MRSGNVAAEPGAGPGGFELFFVKPLCWAGSGILTKPAAASGNEGDEATAGSLHYRRGFLIRSRYNLLLQFCYQSTKYQLSLSGSSHSATITLF